MYLSVRNVEKGYGSGEGYIKVLKSISTGVEQGEMCVLLGPSGSGKSTLLNMIGGLDSAEKGEIVIDDMNIVGLSQKKLSVYRRDYLGFIFQFYNLVPNLTVRENIMVCEYLSEAPMDLDELVETLGLSDHLKKFPSQLSGGQQQRCAIARALIKNPKLLLCDEPTGALDYKTSKDILKLLEDVNKKYGTTMVIVTHNTAIKDMVHRVIQIKDGLVQEDYVNEQLIPAVDLEW